MDNNEVDEKRITFGPIVGAVAIFCMLMATVATTWYLCKQNTKGEIAESEVKVRKSDGIAAKEFDEELEAGIVNAKYNQSKRSYDTDCAGMSLRDMRGGVRKPQVHQ